MAIACICILKMVTCGNGRVGLLSGKHGRESQLNKLFVSTTDTSMNMFWCICSFRFIALQHCKWGKALVVLLHPSPHKWFKKP